MKNNDSYWQIAILCGVALACSACAPSDKEVGSACKNGVCPAALATELPVCVASDLTAQIEVTNEPDQSGEAKLGMLCLPRKLASDDAGKVPCSVTWTLLTDGSGGAPAHCSDLPFLTATTDTTTCVVDQIGASASDASTADGWYYSEDPEKQCSRTFSSEILFTNAARAPAGVRVSLSCSVVQEVAADGKITSSDGAICTLPSNNAQRTKSVGDTCMPKVVPTDGFSEEEVYVQTGSTECATGACLVYHLNGDPTPGCQEVDAGDTSACNARRPGDGAHPECDVAAPRCAAATDIDDRVYCSCRCNAPDGADECKCPSGFACVDSLQDGPDALRGGYCVRKGT